MDNNFIILLLCTLNVDKRISTRKRNNKEIRLNDYKKCLDKWKNTEYNICVVENSGCNELKYLYENCKNFHFLTYQTDYKNQTDNPNYGEVDSLNHFIENYEFINNYKYIIKLTGRYFIEDMEILKSNLNTKKSFSCITSYFNTESFQNINDKFDNMFKMNGWRRPLTFPNWQNTEIIVGTYNFFVTTIPQLYKSSMTQKKYIEHIMFDIKQKNKNSVITMSQPLKVMKTYTGSKSKEMNYI